jgi:hypothetical protein
MSGSQSTATRSGPATTRPATAGTLTCSSWASITGLDVR